MFEQQVIYRHAVLEIHALHALANLGDGGIKHLVRVSQCQLFLEEILADTAQFDRIGVRHQRRIDVLQRNAAIADDARNDAVVGVGNEFLDVPSPIFSHIALPNSGAALRAVLCGTKVSATQPETQSISGEEVQTNMSCLARRAISR